MTAVVRVLAATLRPALLLHGQVPPYGRPTPDLRLGAIVVPHVAGPHVEPPDGA